jgi:ABC-2 type transport system permease protein
VRGALAQEWLRLRTLRSTWWLGGSSVVLTALLAVAFTLTAGSISAARGSMPSAHGVLADQESFATVLSSAVHLTTLLMGLMGVFAFGHEYRHGTILPTLTSVPHRARVAGAKLLVVTAWSAAVGVVCVAVSALVAVLLRSDRFAPGVGFGDGPTARVAAGTVLLVVLYALAGLAFGWLLRSIPAAVALLFVLPIAVEPLLRVILSIKALDSVAGLGRFLPFTAGAQLVAYSTRIDPNVPTAFRNDLTPLAGGLTLTATIAVLLVAAYLLFQHRDA